MVAELEYHSSMQRLILATVVVFGLAALLLIPAATAQINGVPASVTSIGFGGHGIQGVPASVTSLGPNGFHPRNPFFNEPTCCINPLFPISSNPSFGHHRHHNPVFPVAVPVYTMPYTPVVVMQGGSDEPATENEEDEYRGGPTIFDRRGPGRSSYDEDRYAARARRDERDTEPAPPAAPAAATPVADQPDTVLIFKDGHHVEVQNYAVVGTTLYDLSAGHRRKIALAELDLAATAKENDDRGIDFRLPLQAQAN
jgi:hypothetical protein